MPEYLFKNPLFIKTAILPKDYPALKDDRGCLLPEIAVVGRSNVGKSSLLNNLFGKQKLVRTSSTPGKTQAINFFTLNSQLAFVDLPGYGYAKVPPSVRKEWGPMIEKYFSSRPSLKLMLFLFDIRRKPNDEDLLLINWAIKSGLHFILILTKTDKVNKNEKSANTQKILDSFCNNIQSHSEIPYLHYSCMKNVGKEKLIAMISETLNKLA